PTREVIVAGAGRAQSSIARTDRELASGGFRAGGHQHDALHHLGNGGRGETMIAVPPLLLDGEQPCSGQSSEGAAGGLRGDAGNVGGLGGRERAPGPPRLQPAGTGWITRERGHFREHCVASHWLSSW